MTTTKEKSGRRYARPQSEMVSDNISAKPKAGENTSASPLAPRETKIGKVITMLQRNEGATLAEMVEATCWQPHTARAAMTGLRKKGHTIERCKRAETARYLITPSSDA